MNKKQVLVAAMVAAAVPASADILFGGTRTAGMGGAGLALPATAAEGVVRNPALYAFTPRFQLMIPSFGVETRNITFRQALDEIGSVQRGLDIQELGGFARRFGEDRTEFGVIGDFGVTAAGLAVSVRGQVSAATIPNAPLQQWAQAGGQDVTQLVGQNPQLDGYGYGYYSFDVAYATPVRVPDARLTVGARARTVQAYYAHYIANEAAIVQDQTAQLAPEMGGEELLSRNGMGFDLGFLYTPDNLPNLHLGLAVNNIVEPRVGFDRTLPDGTFGDQIQPFRRNLSVGAGYQVGRTLLLAADLVDIGNNAGQASLRIGGELAVAPNLAVRAGYNTDTALAVGVSAFGFNLAFGGRAPLSVTTGVRF
jgi:hypothetical protein